MTGLYPGVGCKRIIDDELDLDYYIGRTLIYSN